MSHPLRALRNERGLYAREVAKTAGIAVGTYVQWECHGVPPQVGAAVRLARALGCSVEDLLDEDENKKGPSTGK